ncbi:hypothetical protein FKP32DRAFT_138127 [Trametes sanguinea]|nr:hypothetical protein FKP32DRAFT_138127 [Trametes sanguinea]
MSGNIRRECTSKAYTVGGFAPSPTREEVAISRLVSAGYVPLLRRIQARPEEVLTMIEQVTHCLDVLFHHVGILHREVSLHNVMWQPSESHSGGEGNFVLCDFDLPVPVDRGSEVDGALSSEATRIATEPRRTGTLPFLALELLIDDSTPHRLYHDYESLLWVVLWCALKVDYHDKNTDRAAIDKILNGWQSTNLNRIYCKKRQVLEASWLALPLSQRFKSSMPIMFSLEAFSLLIVKAPADVKGMQLAEVMSVKFGAKARSRGDMMDSLVCKKTIMEALEGAAKQAEELEARMAAASRSQPEPLAT